MCATCGCEGLEHSHEHAHAHEHAHEHEHVHEHEHKHEHAHAHEHAHERAPELVRFERGVKQQAVEFAVVLVMLVYYKKAGVNATLALILNAIILIGVLAYFGAVLTLPGNPVSAALSFELFVRPALLAAIGHPQIDRRRQHATASSAMKSPAGRRQYRRGHYDAGSVRAVPVGGPGSHLLAAFAQSNCLIEIPEDVTEVPEGGEVTLVMLIP